MQTDSELRVFDKAIIPNRVYKPMEFCNLMNMSLRFYQILRAKGDHPKALILNPESTKNKQHRYLGSDILEWLKGRYE